MVFSYIASVVLLSFALYGVWHIIKDIWRACLAARRSNPVRTSLLLIVRNCEQEIEGMIRYLLHEATLDPFWCELVVVDCASDDITPFILERLADKRPDIKVVRLPEGARPSVEGLNFCHGEVVYVLDTVNRLRTMNFTAAIGQISRQM